MERIKERGEEGISREERRGKEEKKGEKERERSTTCKSAKPFSEKMLA